MMSFLPAAVPKDRLQLEIIKAKVKFKDHNRGYAAFHKLECISQDWIKWIWMVKDDGFSSLDGTASVLVFRILAWFSPGLVFQDGMFLSTKFSCCVTGFSDKNHFAFHGSGSGFSLDLVVEFIGVDDWLLKTGAGFQNIRLCGCFIGSGFLQA